MVEYLQLDSQSDSPLYRQLFEQLRVATQRGDLRDGLKLPPTRELAGRLGLNRSTVSAAYELLESNGLIDAQVGRGSFVRFARESTQEQRIISFAASRPGEGEFPIEDFRASCSDVISGPDAASILQLGSPLGYKPLRQLLFEQALAEGAAAAGDAVLITSGCQQALDLIQRVFVPPGGTVVLEDPVYHGARQVFSRGGTRLLGIGLTAEGIDLDRLARALIVARPDLLVVTPNFQNPTGATMPVGARQALIELACRHDITLVENDTYGELRYEGEKLPSLKSLDDSGRVLLLRSFSKVAFPGMRVGWVIGNRERISRLADARQWCDLHTDQLSQAILHRFAESGRLAQHLDRVRRAGAERLRTTLEACEASMPSGSEWTRPSGGFNVWIRLAFPLAADELLPHAERRGVTYLPGDHFVVSEPQHQALRLSFGGLRPEIIRAGLSLSGQLFNAELERSRGQRILEAAPALV